MPTNSFARSSNNLYFILIRRGNCWSVCVACSLKLCVCDNFEFADVDKSNFKFNVNKMRKLQRNWFFCCFFIFSSFLLCVLLWQKRQRKEYREHHFWIHAWGSRFDSVVPNVIVQIIRCLVQTQFHVSRCQSLSLNTLRNNGKYISV